MKIVVVSENVSKSMSGEALLAFQFIRFMQKRDLDVELVCHERVREDLKTFWPDPTLKNVHFVKESRLQTLIWKTTGWLPYRVRDLIVNQVLHIITQIRARQVVRDLVRDKGVDVVFEPAPITPKGISCMYDVGAPVVIGPMCGGLEFPPAFRFMDSWFSRVAVRWGRVGSHFLHRIFPGKLQADALIVANGCTQKALPRGFRGKVYRVVESGVDLSQWDESPTRRESVNGTRFIYTGRFVDWKGIEYLVDAFALVAAQTDATLELVGDGELMPAIRSTVAKHCLQDRVRIHGWIKHDALPKLMGECDCMVMPSLRECGGTAMLEAMAIGMPLIGTAWAGPKNYINSTCGLLVEPSSPKAFVDGLAAAMIQMARSPQQRWDMGRAAQERVRQDFFDWDAKTERIIEILQEVVDRRMREN